MLRPTSPSRSIPNRLVKHYGKQDTASPNGNWATRSNWLGRDNDAPYPKEREWEYDYFFAESEFAKKYKLEDNYTSWANCNTNSWQEYFYANKVSILKHWLKYWSIFVLVCYWRWQSRYNQMELAPKGLPGLADEAYFPFQSIVLSHFLLPNARFNVWTI